MNNKMNKFVKKSYIKMEYEGENPTILFTTESAWQRQLND